MKVARILRFGPPNVITNDDLPRPEAAAGQLLVRVKAAGSGIGMRSSVRARYPTSPCLSFSVTSYQESSKPPERKSAGSSLATKYTERLTSNSPELTQNMRCLWPE